MTPTPPSTTSSSGPSPDTQFRVVRKRNRIPLSCGPCRHRKLKCNRGHPCDNCTKRGDTSSCTYATPGSRKKSSSSNGSTASPDDMQNRIDRLESLVLSLMTNGPQAAGPTAAQAALANSGSVSGSSADMPLDIDRDDSLRGESIKEEHEGEDSEIEQVSKSLGVMKVEGNKAFFASEAHWYAILGELAEVKNYFQEHKKQYNEQLERYKASQGDDARPGTMLLFGLTKQADHTEILSAFPLKATADRLITRYFNTYDPAMHIIHGPTFQKEYDRHWLNPTDTPVIWIGMAFAMMCIALQSYHRAGDEPPELRGKSWDLSGEFRQRTAQCLLLADVTSTVLYTLETLILHVQSEFARSRDAELGILVMVSLVVRLAMRMGYHRDSAPYANITPFQGEMRRRVWAALRTSDLLFSFQAGMPPMIRPMDTNTELPRNLYDDELYDDMKSLPPSRPMTEATPTSYMITKARLVYAFGEVAENTFTFHCTGYETVMKLDQRLRELHAQTPPHLVLRPLDELPRDPASLIMQRFSLELLYLKSLCVLHRKFIGPSRENSRFAYSRRTCIDACMALLQHQATLHLENQPGGRLRSVKWFISSLTTHDFLLAAMVLCLDLYHTSEAERKGKSPGPDLYAWTQESRDNMVNAIESAVGIWESLRDGSMEAYKAHAILSVMLSKLKAYQAMRQAQQNFATNGGFPNGNVEDDNVAPEHSAAMTLGMLSTGALTPGTANMFQQQENRGGYPSGMSNILNDVQGGQQQSGGTGLTPNYSGLSGNTTGGENTSIQATTSPFSNFFGPNIGFQSMDIPGQDINWDAWDSYITGTSLEPGNMAMPPMWDMPTMDPAIEALGQNQNQQQQQQPNMSQGQPQQSQAPTSNNAFSGSGGVFMGVSTPPGGGMM